MLRLAADEAELITIAVDPKWRGKGVGVALLRAAFDDLMMTRARRRCSSRSPPTIPAALRLYRSDGLRQDRPSGGATTPAPTASPPPPLSWPAILDNPDGTAGSEAA